MAARLATAAAAPVMVRGMVFLPWALARYGHYINYTIENHAMSKAPFRLAVIGHRAAGLTAALAAAEAARLHDLAADITVVEKIPEASAGGNTLWSPSYMRLEAPDRIAADFEDEMLRATNG